MFGSEDADCPLWRAPCKQHKCRWYIQVIGPNPNTGVQENKFDCAVAWLPILQIETSQQARQAGASMDKVANEVKAASDAAAVRDVHLINGIKASFPVLRLAAMNEHLLGDGRDDDAAIER